MAEVSVTVSDLDVGEETPEPLESMLPLALVFLRFFNSSN